MNKDCSKFDRDTIEVLLYNTEHSALDGIAHAFHTNVADFVNDEDFDTYPYELRVFYETILKTALQLLRDHFYCGKETERLFEIYNIKKSN